MNQYVRKMLLVNNGKGLCLRKSLKLTFLNKFEVRNISVQNNQFKQSNRSWFSLRSAFTRWTPLGIAVYLGYLYEKGITEETTQIEITCYSYLPLRIVSKLWGKIANIEVPVSKRPYVYGKYSYFFDVNLEEAITDDFTQYDSLATFFARNLKPDARHIEQDGCLVAPCDGRVLSCGPVTDNRVEQVKGVTYTLQSFFGIKTWDSNEIDKRKTIENSIDIPESDHARQSNKLGNLKPYGHAAMKGYEEDIKQISNKTNTRNSYYGSILESSNRGNILDSAEKTKEVVIDPNSDSYYNSILKHPETNILHECVIYLAPGDYHRFHAPCDWSAKFRRHFSGKLLSVNPIMAKLIPGLFCVNERAVYVGDWFYGFFSYTAVGATNVGSIQVYKDNTLHTNGRKQRSYDERVLGSEFTMTRGEMVGQFNMGSTIVLIFEAPRDFHFCFKDGERVKMGQILGKIVKT